MYCNTTQTQFILAHTEDDDSCCCGSGSIRPLGNVMAPNGDIINRNCTTYNKIFKRWECNFCVKASTTNYVYIFIVGANVNFKVFKSCVLSKLL